MKRCEMDIRYFAEVDMLYIMLMDGISLEISALPLVDLVFSQQKVAAVAG